MASSPQVPNSTSSKRSSRWDKRSPIPKEQPDNCDTVDHHTSIHKDRSRSDKGGRHDSDRKSGSISCKQARSPSPFTGSMEHRLEEPCIDGSSCAPSGSSCVSYRSPSRRLTELQDHPSSTVPTSSSTPISCWGQPHYWLGSSDSRISVMPVDPSIYGSFHYYGPTGISRGGATPGMASFARSNQVSSTLWLQFGLTSTPSTQTLTAEQSVKIFNLAAKCQVLGAILAKQFQIISGLETMHYATTQPTAHEMINAG